MSQSLREREPENGPRQVPHTSLLRARFKDAVLSPANYSSAGLRSDSWHADSYAMCLIDVIRNSFPRYAGEEARINDVDCAKPTTCQELWHRPCASYRSKPQNPPPAIVRAPCASRWACERRLGELTRQRLSTARPLSSSAAIVR